MRSLRFVAPLVVIAACAVAPSATAEKTEAAKLFDKGLEAFLAGDHAKGCPLLERSYGLEPFPGVLFTLAECEAGWGKLATAVERYEEFLKLVQGLKPAEAAKHRERVTVAEKKLPKLRKRVPKLRLKLPEHAESDVSVLVDGRDVTSSVSAALYLNPGRHRIEVMRPGAASEVIELELAPGDERSLPLVVPEAGLGDDGAAAAPVEREPEADADEGGTPTSVYVLGGVGLAGIAIGGVTGLLALSEKGAIDDNCRDRVCNDDGLDAVDRGQGMATISTIAFGVGLAASAGALAIWLTSDDDAPGEGARDATARSGLRAGVAPSASGVALSLSGRF